MKSMNPRRIISMIGPLMADRRHRPGERQRDRRAALDHPAVHVARFREPTRVVSGCAEHVVYEILDRAGRHYVERFDHFSAHVRILFRLRFCCLFCFFAIISILQKYNE